MIILKWLLEPLKASEAEILTFQKIGGRGYKKWGFEVSPHHPWSRAVDFFMFLGTKCNNLVKEIVCRNFVQGSSIFCKNAVDYRMF